MRRITPLTAVAFAALTLLLATTGHAAVLDGVTMADSYPVGGARLELNGMALRDKFFIKVYVGGLYLSARSKNADEVIRQDAPKALVMQFMRSVKRDKLIQAYTEGFANNAPELAARQQVNVERLFSFLSDVQEGDRLNFVYQPGQGSTLQLNNAGKLTIAGKEFADLFLRVYIGPHPPTAEVKRGLLGL